MQFQRKNDRTENPDLTKYLGGHGYLTAGVVVASRKIIVL